MALYLYLFITVSGSFSIKLSLFADHTALVLLLLIGIVVLLVLLARVFWEHLAKLRGQLLSGGAILRSPRRRSLSSSCRYSAAIWLDWRSSASSSALTASQ